MAILTPKQVLDKAGTSYLQRLATAFEANRINATGKTLAAIRKQVSETGLTVLGPEHIEAIEEGNPPGEPVFSLFPKIQEWVRTKGIPLKAAWPISKKISERGTLLWNNEDGRYNRPSGVLSAPVEPIVKSVTGDLLLAYRSIITSQILREFRGGNRKN